MGWEPQEVTQYEYDDDGRLIRSVVHREPEWDDQQRTLMFAAHRLATEPRGRHGYPMREALDPSIAWDVEAVTDPVQKKIDSFEAEQKKLYPKDPMHGVSFIALKRE